MIANDKLFDKLRFYSMAKFLVSTTTAGEDTMTESKGPRESGGLVPGHCYAILKVIEVYTGFDGTGYETGKMVES